MRLFIALAVGAILLGAGVAIGTRVPQPVCEYVFHTHVVRSGETLWNIAKSYSPRGRDLRAVVYNIEIANGLDGAMIHPGQVLTVPIEGSR